MRFIIVGAFFFYQTVVADSVEDIKNLQAQLSQKRTDRLDINYEIRMRGKVKLVNSDSKVITVYFAGSTHDPNAESEIQFLKPAFPELGTNLKCDLHAEQQGQDSSLQLVNELFVNFEKNFGIPLSRQEAEMVKAAKELREDLEIGGELGGLEKHFTTHSLKVRNTDLNFNSAALDYIYEKFGPERVYQAVVYSVQFYFHATRTWDSKAFAKEKLELVINKILQTTKHAEYFKKNPIEKYSQWVDANKTLDPSFSNEEREAHMLQELLQSKVDICLAAHAGHVMGILEAAKDRVKSFEITSIEPREPLRSELRANFELCKKIWEPIKYPSSFSCTADAPDDRAKMRRGYQKLTR